MNRKVTSSSSASANAELRYNKSERLMLIPDKAEKDYSAYSALSLEFSALVLLSYVI